MNDPLDHLTPDELIEEASKHLLEAFAILDGLRRALRGEPVLSHEERLNVVRFSNHPAGPTCRARVRKTKPVPPSPGGRGGDGRGGQGVRFPRKVE